MKLTPPSPCRHEWHRQVPSRGLLLNDRAGRPWKPLKHIRPERVLWQRLYACAADVTVSVLLCCSLLAAVWLVLFIAWGAYDIAYWR